MVYLENLKSMARDPKPLLEAVGLYMVGVTQRAFADQGRPKGAWVPRSVPNRAGILEDLRTGREPPSRRWDATPAGLDTGRLRSSIAYRVQGSTVVVGSNLEYATDVQRGATKKIPVAGDLRKRLADWLRSLHGAEKVRARQAMGFLFATGSLTVTTPARPFLMVTAEDKRRIREMVLAFFRGGK